MRPSVLYTHGRLRWRVGSLRHNAPHSSSVVGTRSAGASTKSTVLSFFPREEEFVRKRFLYFSSGSPKASQEDQTIGGRHRVLGHRLCDNLQQQQQQKLFHTLLPQTTAHRRNGDLRGCLAKKNLSMNFIPLLTMGSRHHRGYCYAAKPIDARVLTTVASFPPSPLSISAHIPVAWMSTSSSTPTSTPTSAPKLTMASTIEDDSENESQEQQVEGASSTVLTSDATNSDTESDATTTTTPTEQGWKRVRTIKVPRYGPDADKAVRSLQSARKERARVKTSINVQRALYGNMVICVAKLGAWASSGSSSMMSEFVHSVVDCGNQALLLVGLRHTRNAADKRHPYGYGKSVYFWALVSALGTFFMGAGISMSHSVQTLFHPTLGESISSEVWFVLAMSFIIDGFVLYKTYSDIEEARPKSTPIAEYISKLRDPATLAVLMEDAAACLGIVIAIAGIAASHATTNPIYDGIAGVGISFLLAGVGLALVRVNHSFLIGQAVDREMLDKIEQLIRNRRSIDNVTGIQSQWTGPETFSFKAELDFDGTYLSALLVPRYRAEFQKAGDALDEDLEVLLSWYAEDVIRAVEREVRHIEAVIRQQYPGAEYIELEPMSKYVDRFAIDDSFEEKLMMIEKKELKKWVRVLYENKAENAWKDVTSPGEASSEGNVVSGSVPTDTIQEGGSKPPSDTPEK